MKIATFKKLFLAFVGLSLVASCAKDRSTATGWNYNDYENGGFEKYEAQEQETGPGLILVEGGTFTMGQTEQDVMFDWNARPARVTVSSFYMDRTEVTNFHWLEYMYWMKRVYYKSYPHVYKKSLPDTLAWRTPLGYMEKYADYYLRHPSYRDYPVVGVSWLQANDFCKWRTDRVNEAILVREGIIKWHFAYAKDHDNTDVGAAQRTSYDSYYSTPQNMFSTENYLNGTYMVETGSVDKVDEETGEYSIKGGYTLGKAGGKANSKNKNSTAKNSTAKSTKDDEDGKITYTNTSGEDGPSINKRKIPRDPYVLENFDPVYADLNKGRLGTRPVRIEDGMLLPNYRLPTEAEWEFAALGLKGNLDPSSENISERRIYPWDGHYVRQEEQQFAGAIQANFMRGKGDMMGIAGNLNDGGDVTVRVDDFWPNDYGLYHMAGNVSEWVMDVYRPMSSEVFAEFMPFRGNVYKTQLKVPDGLYDKPVKANENIYDVLAMKEYVNEYARILYLSDTKRDLSKDPKVETKYSSNYGSTPKNGPLDGFSSDLSADKTVLTLKNNGILWDPKKNNNKSPEWDLSKLPAGVTMDPKFKVTDSIIELQVATPTVFKVSLKKGNAVSREREIVAKDPIVNTIASRVQIKSRQDTTRYKYNAPSSNFISSNSKFTKNDSIQFAVLDDINAILDTAIYLQSKGNATKASAYIETVLFGNRLSEKSISVKDYRNYDRIDLTDYETKLADLKDPIYNTETVTGGENYLKVGFYFIKYGDWDFSKNMPSSFNLILSSIFSNEYLTYRFKDYQQDPNITSWVLTLRNGLTEFVTETKGNQRWRNVTIKENKDRLNYRKDDYIDYLDGDLESSIYYNNKKKIEDVNAGRRDPKQVMYQSQYENQDMKGEDLADGSSGWPTTLISDKSRVYKGGSWADRTYWMSPGSRRFLDEDKSSAMIGFRCAMDRVGSSRPNRKKQ
ncbi:MAG: SUMF1/EgtB/PvdO family nonheme iron enzyme [Crocinitomicaceae bacterium]